MNRRLDTPSLSWALAVRLVMFNKIVWNTWEKLRWPHCESRWHGNIPCNQGTFETFKANLISAKINKATATSKWELVGQRKDVSKLPPKIQWRLCPIFASFPGEIGSLNDQSTVNMWTSLNLERLGITGITGTALRPDISHQMGQSFLRIWPKECKGPRSLDPAVKCKFGPSIYIFYLPIKHLFSSHVSFTLRTLMLGDRLPCPRNSHFSQIALVWGGVLS